MDSQAGDKDSKAGCVIPLSEHPLMDRLDEILRALSSDRRDALDHWVSERLAEDTIDHSSEHKDG